MTFMSIDVQDVPETWSDQRMHVLDRDCWCKPLVEITSATQNTVKHKAMTDDLTTPEKPAPDDLEDDGADDEALPDVRNDPIPEPAQPEEDPT